MEILQKQGVATLDRPRLIAASEILSGGMRTVLTRAGPRIRKLRRALLSQLGLAAVVQYQPLQMRNAREYILDLLSDPEEPTNINDPDVQGMKLYMSRFTKYMPVGSHVVDGWPILKYVPFVTSDLRRWHREETSFYKRLINNIRDKMAAHIAQPCFTSYLLEHQQQFDLNDNELGFLTGSMYGAGSETTAAALMFMVMAAAKYPEEAAKVRTQLDAIIGHSRRM
ncbi:hypothetical protein EIP86_004249 [Pleurotus ostreatoroseus]|nr:hypothetical protein EIP86_004249 [Pleurotus ostreatoroseus]